MSFDFMSDKTNERRTISEQILDICTKSTDDCEGGGLLILCAGGTAAWRARVCGARWERLSDGC